MTTLPLTTPAAATTKEVKTLFLDTEKLKNQAELVEASGTCLQCPTASTADQDAAILQLLSVTRAAQQEHKKINKLELRCALFLGQHLIQAKASLKHGEYGPFLLRFGITTQDASRFSVVANNWDEIERKGYTDYSVSTVVQKLKQDGVNAEHGDMQNAEFKERADYASEASGREAQLLLQLSEANRTNQRLQSELARTQSELARYQAMEAATNELTNSSPAAVPVHPYEFDAFTPLPQVTGPAKPDEPVAFNLEEALEAPLLAFL